eukprot:gb/GEZN01018518.1/.p1 GENE.gb/GEZN01018518.1/~~gb/GEZN01018518.1/.p1  ORF type:complete len:130 (+),score=22.17 gb/GEZN01018518.1/:36-425(+)
MFREPAPAKIDREKTCPLLLRVFYKIGGHHTVEDYAKELPADELQIYTWKNASLEELTTLIKGVTPEARKPDAMLSFALVYPDKEGKLKIRQVAQTFAHRRSQDDRRTLQQLQFETGDYLDVAVRIPQL